MDNATYFSISYWRVKEGRADEFWEIWRRDIATVIHKGSPEAAVTIARSMEDSHLFTAVAPWPNLEEMQSVFGDRQVLEAQERLTALCDEVRREVFEIVGNIP